MSCNKFRKNFKRVQVFFQSLSTTILARATKTDDTVVRNKLPFPPYVCRNIAVVADCRRLPPLTFDFQPIVEKIEILL